MKDSSKMSVSELRVELRDTRAMLAAADCPYCGKDTDDQWCTWCQKRSELLEYRE